MNTQDYIANCLFRIFTAPNLAASAYRRAYDVAEVIHKSNGFEGEIHLGLVALCQQAEAGYYNQPLPTGLEPSPPILDEQRYSVLAVFGDKGNITTTVVAHNEQSAKAKASAFIQAYYDARSRPVPVVVSMTATLLSPKE